MSNDSAQAEWDSSLKHWKDYVARREASDPRVTDATRKEYSRELRTILSTQKKAERASIEAYLT